jgi:AraC-like DNA-binding protein
MYTGYQETILYQSQTVTIGSFRCAPWYPRFEEVGKIKRGHTIVFPRTSVFIIQEGSRPFLTDPNLAVFYNLRQPYRRKKFSEVGDICDFFAFQPALVLDAILPYDPTAAGRGENPFDFSFGPTQASTYLLQRRLVETVCLQTDPSSLYVEETSLEILARTVASAYKGRPQRVMGNRTHHGTRSAHRELVQQARAILNARFEQSLSLQAIAQELYVSPYHLCRIFHRETGSTIHSYLEQIRLRVALDYVLPGAAGDVFGGSGWQEGDLTSVAHALGFSSHSHFTQAIRKTYGLPPTELRNSIERPAIK